MRGGAREGAGRHKVDDPKISKSITLNKSVWDAVANLNPEKTVQKIITDNIMANIEKSKNRANQNIKSEAKSRPSVCKICAEGEEVNLNEKHLNLICEHIIPMFMDRKHEYRQTRTERAFNEAMALETILRAIKPSLFGTVLKGTEILDDKFNDNLIENMC